MYYSIFVILFCITLAIIFIDGFFIKKNNKVSSYIIFLTCYVLSQKEANTSFLTIVCLLILLLIYYENRDKN